MCARLKKVVVVRRLSDCEGLPNLRTACLRDRAGSAIEYQNDSRANPGLVPSGEDDAGASMSKWIFLCLSTFEMDVAFLVPVKQGGGVS